MREIQNEENNNESEIKKLLLSGDSEIVIHGGVFSKKEEAILNEGRNKVDSLKEDLKVFNPESKKQVKIEPDIDGRAAVFLLEEAGIKYNRLTFVKKGDWVPGGINIDTGEKSGILVERNNAGLPTVFIDHHGQERGAAHSATRLVYDVLKYEKLLDDSPWLDSLVKFVDEVDDENYKLDKDFFINGWSQSFYCLYKFLPLETMIEYFKKGASARSPFTDEEFESGTIKTTNGRTKPIKLLCEKQQNSVDMNIREMAKTEKEMYKSGIKTFEETFLKKVIVNLYTLKKASDGSMKKIDNIPLGFTAVRALGFDSYVKLNDDSGGFFITSKNTLDGVFKKISEKFPDAKLIRGTMIIRNPTGENVDIRDFLETLNLLE